MPSHRLLVSGTSVMDSLELYRSCRVAQPPPSTGPFYRHQRCVAVCCDEYSYRKIPARLNSTYRQMSSCLTSFIHRKAGSGYRLYEHQSGEIMITPSSFYEEYLSHETEKSGLHLQSEFEARPDIFASPLSQKLKSSRRLVRILERTRHPASELDHLRAQSLQPTSTTSKPEAARPIVPTGCSIVRTSTSHSGGNELPSIRR